jgi:hypothetical protein
VSNFVAKEKNNYSCQTKLNKKEKNPAKVNEQKKRKSELH